MAPSAGKTLLVIDQFEQWLQAHPHPSEAILVAALRQCDGCNLQALLLVRDDFWMAVTRFFKAIEVPLIEGVNTAPVELFDQGHAVTVLKKFGRACGRFPDPPDDSSPQALKFLQQAVAEMADTGGGVTPIRLCLFAEVVRRRPWTPSTLRELGGFEGIGVTFLIETFDSASAPLSYRLHRKAALATLEALLPGPASLIRGAARSASELREAAGYHDRPGDFADMMRILDSELRMISLVDQSLEGNAPAAAGSRDEPCYQLAHDFLVVPIRQWIDRRRQSTRTGRAQTRLATLTAFWVQRPARQRLPSMLEWAGILYHTRRRTWSTDERRLMRAASRMFLTRTAAAVALIAAGLVSVQFVRDREQAAVVLRRVLEADDRNLASLLPEVDRHRDRLRDDLERLERDPLADGHDRDLAVLLLFRDDPTSDRAEILRDRLQAAGPDRHRLISDALARSPDLADAPGLRRTLLDESRDLSVRLRTACAWSRSNRST